AVWFRDPLDAHLALALRLLRGPAPREWYWRLAVPGAERAAADGPAAAVRAVARSLAERPEAPVALPRWFAGLVAAGVAEPLAAALTDEDVHLLARAAGLPPERARRQAAAAGETAVDDLRPPLPATARPRASAAAAARVERARGAARRLVARMLRAAG